jgi:hypothetical protein
MFAAVESLVGIVILVTGSGRRLAPASPSDIAGHFIDNVVAGQFFGGPFDYLQHRELTLLAIGVAAIASIVLLLVDRPHSAVAQLVVALGALVLGGVTYLLEAATQGATARYAVAPALFILFGVAIVADVVSRLNVARAIAGVAALAVALSWVLSFPAASFRDTGPRWAAEYSIAQRACDGRQTVDERVPILPIGWTLTLPCSAIR